ncbi:GerAB/ArcD/ProY family transporter [Ferdinandcohnia sp. Marseille-Q9671]
MMDTNVKDQARISHFLVFYLIHGIQVGVGILGFQRHIAQHAGYDAWMAVILTGIMIHIVIWLMYKMLHASNGDLHTIHQELVGKWIGNVLNACFIIYFTLQAFTILRSFLMVIQVWMFSDLKVWQFSLIYLLLVYYGVSKGFRSVTGICFFGIVIPAYLSLTFIIPFFFGEPRHLLPIFTHSVHDIWLATKNMTYSFLGVSTLLIYYPFLKNPRKSEKWAYFGNVTTILLYLLITFSTFVYYSEAKLSHTIWATLTMWKIVSFPIIERFEYIGITTWILVILPNLCLFIWAASRVGKQILKIRQKNILLVILVLIYVPTCLINDIETIYIITDMLGRIGFYILYVYIPVLAVSYLIYKKVRKTS